MGRCGQVLAVPKGCPAPRGPCGTVWGWWTSKGRAAWCWSCPKVGAASSGRSWVPQRGSKCGLTIMPRPRGARGSGKLKTELGNREGHRAPDTHGCAPGSSVPAPRVRCWCGAMADPAGLRATLPTGTSRARGWDTRVAASQSVAHCGLFFLPLTRGSSRRKCLGKRHFRATLRFTSLACRSKSWSLLSQPAGCRMLPPSKPGGCIVLETFNVPRILARATRKGLSWAQQQS